MTNRVSCVFRQSSPVDGIFTPLTPRSFLLCGPLGGRI